MAKPTNPHDSEDHDPGTCLNCMVFDAVQAALTKYGWDKISESQGADALLSLAFVGGLALKEVIKQYPEHVRAIMITFMTAIVDITGVSMAVMFPDLEELAEMPKNKMN